MIVSGENVGRWVCSKLQAAYQEGAQGIGLVRDGSLVAGVCYDNYRRRSIMAHIVVEGLLDPNYVYAIFHYPFVHLGVTKVIAPIAQSNGRSIRLCEKMGFEREATLSDVDPSGDIYLYTLKREKCRFTGGRYEQRFVSTARA